MMRLATHFVFGARSLFRFIGRLANAGRSGLKSALLAAALSFVLSARAQNAPHIGYVYPAGGRQGAEFQVVVGGQFLGSVSNAFVSGAGVETKVVEHNRPMNQKEFNELRDKLKELREKMQANRKSSNSTNTWTAADEKTIEEIRAKIIKNPPNRQGNPAIAETVTLQVIVSANAGAGEREIRLSAPNGLSNPLLLCIGQLPEISKPAAKTASTDIGKFLERLGWKPSPTKFESRVSLPATVNGQILPGAADRYRFFARTGQKLIVAVSARGLIPYIPDAVPGWFQATLALYDARGKELAYADDFRFNPDPVLCFDIPKNGDYVVEIKDSIYRGREDFVYRISMGELPFVTSIFPLGGPAGVTTTVEFKGWNLSATNLTQEVMFTEPGVYQLSTTNGGHVSNPMPFAVDALPACVESEPNNSPETAQHVTLPIIINGRIDKAGDLDVFSFEGRVGSGIVAEVTARRLNSPLDSVLRLTDATGKQIAFNDDFEDKGAGLETHHADSYIRVTLPANGVFYLHMADAQHNGGPEFGYRLRLSAPRPDFALRVVPASLSVRAGMNVPLTVRALRKDGFTNDITLLLDEAPPGFVLSGNRVPANQDQARLTLKSPPSPLAAPVAVALKGFAFIGGRAVFRPAVPAEDMMQAFAYRHLVPAKELKVAVLENRRPLAMAGVRILSATPLKVPAGGTGVVRIATPTSAFADRFELELDAPPEGIVLQRVSPTDQGVEVELQCDAAKAKPGLRGNLIINILPAQNRPRAQAGQRPGVQRRVPVGTLPAIPFEIVPQQ